jgi:hypothetical protein
VLGRGLDEEPAFLTLETAPGSTGTAPPYGEDLIALSMAAFNPGASGSRHHRIGYEPCNPDAV